MLWFVAKHNAKSYILQLQAINLILKPIARRCTKASCCFPAVMSRSICWRCQSTDLRYAPTAASVVASCTIRENVGEFVKSFTEINNLTIITRVSNEVVDAFLAWAFLHSFSFYNVLAFFKSSRSISFSSFEVVSQTTFACSQDIILLIHCDPFSSLNLFSFHFFLHISPFPHIQATEKATRASKDQNILIVSWNGIIKMCAAESCRRWWRGERWGWKEKIKVKLNVIMLRISLLLTRSSFACISAHIYFLHMPMKLTCRTTSSARLLLIPPQQTF